jgi:hypothetical protein
MFAHKTLDSLANGLLDENQVGNSDLVMRIYITRQGGEASVRHAHGDRGHVLE